MSAITTFDGIPLVNGRLLPAEEAKANRRWKQQQAKLIPTKGLTPIGDALKGVRASIACLKQQYSNPSPKVQEEPLCSTCKGVKYIRYNLPPGDPFFGKAIPCHECCPERAKKFGNPWITYQEVIEAMFPVPAQIRHLANEPLDELPAYQETTELVDLVEDIADEWPLGIIVAIDGGYGTAKSHAAAILYRLAWENRIGAAYVESAQKLQELFTNFDKEQRQIDVRIQAAAQRFDALTGEELVEEERRLTINRKQISTHLVLVPYLIIDEAHRYSRKGGNGWVEMKLADLINARLLRKKTTILIGNAMGDGSRIGREGSNALHSSILDRCRSADCEWLDLNDVPSGRHRYERTGSWGDNRQRKRRQRD